MADKDEHQYWVVGAMWGGHDDQLPNFLKGGYWYLGWTEEQDRKQNALIDKMRPGDRIAVKRMLGQGSKEIEIRAIGIIKAVIPEAGLKLVFVNWVVDGLERRVPASGCFGSVHQAPVPPDDWTSKVFCI